MGDDLGDAENLEIVDLGEFLQLGKTGHRAVFVHHLADDASGVHASQVAKVDDGLGVPRACQDAARMVAQREEMPGPDEIIG